MIAKELDAIEGEVCIYHQLDVVEGGQRNRQATSTHFANILPRKDFHISIGILIGAGCLISHQIQDMKMVHPDSGGLFFCCGYVVS